MFVQKIKVCLCHSWWVCFWNCHNGCRYTLESLWACWQWHWLNRLTLRRHHEAPWEIAQGHFCVYYGQFYTLPRSPALVSSFFQPSECLSQLVACHYRVSGQRSTLLTAYPMRHSLARFILYTWRNYCSLFSMVQRHPNQYLPRSDQRCWPAGRREGQLSLGPLDSFTRNSMPINCQNVW